MRYHTERRWPTSDKIRYFEHDGAPDNIAAFFVTKRGGLVVAVANEQAVDGYNFEDFECDFSLTREEAIELRDYLNANLSEK